MIRRVWTQLVRSVVEACGRRMLHDHVEFDHNSFDSRLKSWLKLERDVIELRLAKESETGI